MGKLMERAQPLADAGQLVELEKLVDQRSRCWARRESAGRVSAKVRRCLAKRRQSLGTRPPMDPQVIGIGHRLSITGVSLANSEATAAVFQELKFGSLGLRLLTGTRD